MILTTLIVRAKPMILIVLTSIVTLMKLIASTSAHLALVAAGTELSLA